MVTDSQRMLLQQDLPRDVIKTREQGGQRLSYVDGWYAVTRANEVFGPDGWSYAVKEVREVYRGTRQGKGSDENVVIVYEAVVAVTALGITREDVGIGQCDAGPRALAQGIEKGRKEAVTDGLKRALRTFGPSFGLALYDKDQRDVGISRAAMDLRERLAAATDPMAFAREHAEEIRSLEADERDELRALVQKRVTEAKAKAANAPVELPDNAQRAADAQRAANDIARSAAAPTIPAPRDATAEESAAGLQSESDAITPDDLAATIARCRTPGEVASVWHASREDRRAWAKEGTAHAWEAAVLRVSVLQHCNATGAKTWLKKALADLDTKLTPPDGPRGGHRPAGHAPAESTDARGDAAEAAAAQGAVALVPAWCCDEATARAHVEGYAHAVAVQRAAEKYRAGLPPFARRLLALRLVRLSWDPHDGEITEASARELVERWIAQGPQESRARREARAKIAMGGAR